MGDKSVPKGDFLIRFACLDDIQEITEIYNQGIEERIATLEADTKTVEQMITLFKARSNRHRVIVAVNPEGVIKGWASLNVFNARECYRGVADLSIYICRTARGKGLGKILLLELIRVAKQVGFHKMVLSTMAHNYIGHKLYASVGFTKVGTYMNQGMLDGKWIDVTIMEKLLIDD